MQRRYLSLYFPRFAVDRIEREQPVLAATAFAVVWDERGHLYVVAVNDAAANAGIRIGMRLSDARALLPTLQVVMSDVDCDARWMRRMIEWCDRYSPLVEQDGADSIVADITGCAHLFGGEPALLDTVQQCIGAMRFRVHAAIAPTHGAAWALSRYAQPCVVDERTLDAALDTLPVRSLRIVDEIAVELARVGLAAIGQLRRIARDSIATRYGPQVPLRLDQALGRAEEPLTPYHAATPYRVVRAFAEPIGSTLAVEHVLLDLLTTLCARLEKEHRGARRYTLDCHRVDASTVSIEVRTSQTGRSITHLLRLFSEKMSLLDAGFGIEVMALQADNVDTLAPRQLALPQYASELDDDSTLNELLDRMGLRLGFEHVSRIQIRESLLPEHATALTSVARAAAPSAAWPTHRVRPVRLLDPPSPIEIAEIIPGKFPTLVRISGEMHRIVRAEGPERLTPEWWREQPARWSARDYYAIEDEHGMRLWIFRETLRSNASERWFLHGQFA